MSTKKNSDPQSQQAMIAIEDGTVFQGISFGVSGERTGEMVFNTGMAGYQEVLTDPSYKGQMVVMTAPQIGNYGIHPEASESGSVHMDAFIVREQSRIPSHWESREGLKEFLLRHNCMGVEGVDTRALTLRLREQGAMRAVVSTTDLDAASLVEKARNAPTLIGRDLVREVTGQDLDFFRGMQEVSLGNDPHVVVYDFGVKRNIVRSLVRAGCRVSVVRADTMASEVLGMHPDGIMLSNGPGDPEGIPYVVAEVAKLIGTVPMFGICLGHQIIGLALGGRSFKLKFGHHGVNHPVRDVNTGRVQITVQNHGFCIDPESIDTSGMSVTHINLNDRTLEGIVVPEKLLMCVQFHPEAAPGPHDALGLFGDFVDRINAWRAKNTAKKGKRTPGK
ncbi:MAG: glutamine-hydrolyzing carbamoyl-phosphate synthase small subunit [bacterium]